MNMLHRFMLRDLRGASKVRSLWVFCACLILGIALIASCGSLLQLVRDGFSAQERNLFGGDLQVSQRKPVTDDQAAWLNENARVSRLLELRTMMGTQDADFTVVELQSVDENYPLYGQVRLGPDITLQQAVGIDESGRWGAAFDPALAEQSSLEVGQLVYVGDIELELRAILIEQPDRSLRADVRGPPLIIDEAALEASGLVQPTSLIDYDYRVQVDEDPIEWRSRLKTAFPDAEWEVQTVKERGEFITDRLNQVASVLLLIGFSTLLIGGLGVANSVGAYLQTKLRTIATLQSLGSRAAQVSSVYIGQITLLATLASIAGALLGSTVAYVVARSLSERLPIDPAWQALLLPTLLAVALGVFTALAFALPVIGRTLAMPTAGLIKGQSDGSTILPRAYKHATAAVTVAGIVLLLVFVPEPLIAVGFAVFIIILLGLLSALVILIRIVAEKLAHVPALDGHFSMRLAITSLYRPGASLRPMLLSLGTALTLLVTSSLVIAATYNTLNDTVPERVPSLVLYDLQKPQIEEFNTLIETLPGYQDHSLAPLVLGRLVAVNDENLSASSDDVRALEANDEHKLSYRLDNIDNTTVDRGEWWPDNYTGPPLVAMEDREADQIGLKVGDKLSFSILGKTIDAELVAIYSQARLQTSFWLEAVFTNNTLDPFINRYIGSVMLEAGTDLSVQSSLGEKFPNMVSIRTAKVLESSRALLSSASLAMIMIGAVSLIASILVMASVVAVNRQRQVYEASIMHAVGTRMSVVLKSVVFEYLLLAIVLSGFALLAGGLLAQVLLGLWLKLNASGSAWVGATVAVGASTLCLLAGALWLVATLKVSPAQLLKRGA